MSIGSSKNLYKEFLELNLVRGKEQIVVFCFGPFVLDVVKDAVAHHGKQGKCVDVSCLTLPYQIYHTT